MNKEITTNAKEVWDAFENFTQKEMKKAITSGLRKAAGELRKEVRSNLRKEINGATKHNPKFNDTLSQGVRITKVKNNGSYFSVYTTIASNRKTGSGSYRLHFLEAGTVGRYAYIRKSGHKPAYRGSIKPYNFFDNAKAGFNSDKIIQTEIDKAVIKINNKKI